MTSSPNGTSSSEASAASLAICCLEIARQALGEAVTRGHPTPGPLEGGLAEHTASAGGVFVTLRRNGRLRGCIGYPLPDLPVAEAVWRATQQAALADPRFEPVGPGEMPQLEIVISLLSSHRPLTSASEFEPGRHGVIVEVSGKRGLYLPEVATETGWSLERLLDELAVKAGLPATGWRRPDARLSTFETTTAEGPALIRSGPEPEGNATVAPAAE